MTDKVKVTPKDFFLWLGAMAALYFSVGSFIALSFEYIERLVGTSSIIGYDPYSTGIRFAIASLIVLFPVYLLLTRMLNQDIRKHPEKRELWVRRWLVFLTVFAAGIGLIVDLVVLINTFLGGEELTLAFLLKVLVVFILFGSVFYYYLNDIRNVWEKKEKQSKAIAIGVSTIVVLAIVGGFFIMGTPQTQRALRYDQQRLDDLRNIQSQVTEYYRVTEELPATLEDMHDPLTGQYIPTDPLTGDSYEYQPLEGLSFELCATFERPLPTVDETKVDLSDWRVRDLQQTAADWPHEVGRTCFERTVDPDRIKPYTDPQGVKIPVRAEI